MHAVCLVVPQALHVGFNRITEPADLERLSTLGRLAEVSLAGNPLARKQAYRSAVASRCPMLQVLDGQVRICICMGPRGTAPACLPACAHAVVGGRTCFTAPCAGYAPPRTSPKQQPSALGCCNRCR